MKLQRRLAALSAGPNIVPILNVVLLLVFFVLLSSPFVLQPGLTVEPPHGISTGGVASSRLIVTVNMVPNPDPAEKVEKIPGIFFADQLVTLKELGQALLSLKPETTTSPLIVRADQSVPMSVVAEIMNLGLSSGLTVVLATQNETKTKPAAP